MAARKNAKLGKRSLDAIFRPRSIAVIGVSRRKQTIGHEVLNNLMDCEFTGPVYPVNPAADVVHSMKAYRNLREIPGPVDLAIITVPSHHVLKVIDQCGRKGVRGVVVITAGFKEVGEKGALLEKQLVAKLQRYRMRMIGPNCMGVMNTEPEYLLNATFANTIPPRGNVGFISQSGALGEVILADAAQTGLGVAMFVSMGNKADISGNDLLEYWEGNDEIQVILMYLESFGAPRRFTKMARRITRKKPIITVKAGRTDAGAKAASSHTGSIVGMDIATSSLLEQCGVLRVSSLDDLFVQASALANQPLPAGDRIAIVTNAGGPGILCTDACIGRGLRMAELSSKTRQGLAKVLSPEASLNNPVDMIASATPEMFRESLKLIGADAGVDGIIALNVSPVMIDAYEVASAIAESSGGAKPVLCVFMGRQRSDEGVDKLRAARVPTYRFPDQAASAMSALVRYKKLRDRPQGREVTYKVNQSRGRSAIMSARKAGRNDLSPAEVQKLLEAYGFPMVPSMNVSTAAEAIAAAQELGYPVVLKVASEKISHKTDLGGVRIDLRHADEVGQAFRELQANFKKHDPKTRFTIQQHVLGGHEVILGMVNDPQFGPLLMFGLGGVFAEVMRDVSVRIHPLTDIEARAMIEQVEGYPLLAGVRGEKPVALPLLRESLLRLSQLVGDFEDQLAELDINPLIVTSKRNASYIVDARISLRPKK